MNHRGKFENRHEKFLKQMERYKRDAEKIAKKAEKRGLGAQAEWLRESLGITKPIELTAATAVRYRCTDASHAHAGNPCENSSSIKGTNALTAWS
jgi:hypothetical protein